MINQTSVPRTFKTRAPQSGAAQMAGTVIAVRTNPLFEGCSGPFLKTVVQAVFARLDRPRGYARGTNAICRVTLSSR